MSLKERLAEKDTISLYPYILGHIEGIVESSLYDNKTKISEIKNVLSALDDELNGRDTE
ncbi:hypothetical protein [Paenibacillus larvae]|uniref:hypothetical protein n=1 Tax=Paenibacillus larvae TaxID=1464 RepID=UPI0013149C4D|nr:hypothetical protein [Paenibacillus larvae]